MEKKESRTGMYETTCTRGVFVERLSTPTKMSLTDQTKVALLEYLTESDEFHKLVCDITGVERKQVKVSPEIEKLKEDYSHVCNKNQAETTADLVKEIEILEKDYQCQSDLAQKYREKSEKLQVKLDEASKRYDELIKIISVRAIKSI